MGRRVPPHSDVLPGNPAVDQRTRSLLTHLRDHTLPTTHRIIDSDACSEPLAILIRALLRDISRHLEDSLCHSSATIPRI